MAGAARSNLPTCMFAGNSAPLGLTISIWRLTRSFTALHHELSSDAASAATATFGLTFA